MLEKKEKEGYEFIILYDLYDERINEQGEPEYRLRKKDCKRKWFTSDINNLSDLREIPTRKGIPYRNKCEVYHRFENKWLVIQGRFEELKHRITPIERYKIKGFK